MGVSLRESGFGFPVGFPYSKRGTEPQKAPQGEESSLSTEPEAAGPPRCAGRSR